MSRRYRRAFDVQAGIASHVAWYEKHYPTPVNRAPACSVSARRKERERLAGNGWTPEEWRDCLHFFGDKCSRCERGDKQIVPDHVIPLKRGGKHSLSNIQPLCHKCNLWKGLKLTDFRNGRIFAQ